VHETVSLAKELVSSQEGQCKMAERNVVCTLSSEQINYNYEHYSGANCLSCIDLESRLREALLEISSRQYINKLPYKELNNGASMNALGEWKRTTSRSQVSSFKCNHNTSRRSEALQSSQPVPITNRFSVLTKLPDPTISNEATSLEGRRAIDGHNYNYKRKQNQERQSVQNNIKNHRGRTSLKHPTDCHIPQHEPMDQDNSESEPNLTSRKNHNNPRMSASTSISVSDTVNHEDHNTTQHIPTIVNCEVIETISSKVELLNAGNKGSTQNLMSELIMELTRERERLNLGDATKQPRCT
jgi:hypothetical protein